MVSKQRTAVDRRSTTLEDLANLIVARPDHVFAILDACDEPLVPQKVCELGMRAVSLYRGWAERDYWAIAPYLVRVDDDLLKWVYEHLWTAPWGVFAVAPTELAVLRKHFRRFLMVEGPKGDKLYFRFYDPRILEVYLNTCTSRESHEFFGPIESFIVAKVNDQLSELTRVRK